MTLQSTQGVVTGEGCSRSDLASVRSHSIPVKALCLSASTKMVLCTLLTSKNISHMYTWSPLVLYYGLVFFSFATIIIGHILVALCCLLSVM